jgi:hypothetical protein
VSITVKDALIRACTYTKRNNVNMRGPEASRQLMCTLFMLTLLLSYVSTDGVLVGNGQTEIAIIVTCSLRLSNYASVLAKTMLFKVGYCTT